MRPLPISAKLCPDRYLGVGAAEVAAHLPRGSDDPDLAIVVERWADLPEAIRTGIVAMVKAAR